MSIEYIHTTRETKTYCNKFSGSCSGDSGGPAFTVNNGSHELVGLVSFGSSDCLSGLPSIYTNTMMFKSWIEGYVVASTQHLHHTIIFKS